MQPGEYQYIVCPECFSERGEPRSAEEYPGLLLSFGMTPDLVPRIMLTCREHGTMVFSTAIRMKLFDKLESGKPYKAPDVEPVPQVDIGERTSATGTTLKLVH